MFGSAKKIVPKLESVEVVLVHCVLIKNDYEHTSKDLFIFVPNKQFCQLINISPHFLTTMTTVNTSFLLLKFGLQIKLVKHLKSKIISI